MTEKRMDSDTSSPDSVEALVGPIYGRSGDEGLGRTELPGHACRNGLTPRRRDSWAAPRIQRAVVQGSVVVVVVLVVMVVTVVVVVVSRRNQRVGKPLRELKSEWRRACEAAGLVAGRKNRGVVLYNLRHSCRTNLAAAGVPDTTARAISGHKTDSAHRRYVITQEAPKAAALAKMTETVRQLARSA